MFFADVLFGIAVGMMVTVVVPVDTPERQVLSSIMLLVASITIKVAILIRRKRHQAPPPPGQ